MKMVFILMFITQGHFGEDVINMRAYDDRGVCEYKRAQYAAKFITADKCAKMTYTIGKKK